jgi:hypothetical protein
MALIKIPARPFTKKNYIDWLTGPLRRGEKLFSEKVKKDVTEMSDLISLNIYEQKERKQARNGWYLSPYDRRYHNDGLDKESYLEKCKRLLNDYYKYDVIKKTYE